MTKCEKSQKKNDELVSFFFCSYFCASFEMMLHGKIRKDTFLAQHSVAMLEQCCYYRKESRNNVATLCCANNCRCESSRATLPLVVTFGI